MSTEKANTTTAEAPQTPLAKLIARLPEITNKTGHNEMWGVQLDDPERIPAQVVLQKFLRANSNDLDASVKQLTSALEWRKKMQPLSLVSQAYDASKFGGLGFVTVHKDEAGKETVITWNIYGAVKDNKATFGNVEEFIRWRAALMELSLQKLNLNDVKELIPEGGDDPYQMLQVHDYMSVSFFRMDPAVKAASKETISTFSMAYPELLAHKYFVNVPAIMGWMFGAMKLFLAPATLRKFHPMTSGTTLATELPSIVSTLPKEYGGSGTTVKEGFTVSLVEKPVAEKKEEATETTGDDAAPAAPTAAAANENVEDKPKDAAVDGAADGAAKAEPAAEKSNAPKISEAEAAIVGDGEKKDVY